MSMRNLLIVASFSFIVVFTTTPTLAAINIEMVTVGDPGNPGELSGQGYGDPNLERICGAVNYTYQIGKFETTNARYIAFLNSVAGYGDTYNLYKYDVRYSCGNPHRASGIQRTGSGISGDPYVYTVADNDPNWNDKPVTYVNYYDCLRFVNWLQNGQPEGNQVAGVTETGTYTFSGATSVTIPDHSTFTTLHYVLPNEDEWYKAAFYKSGSSDAGYWKYATQSDTTPDHNPPWLDTGNSANYTFSDSNGDHEAVGSPYYVTDVGAYSQSPGPYGTFDQNGNVDEWNDKLPSDAKPRARGGNWIYSKKCLESDYTRDRVAVINDPSSAAANLGFRVAIVPEPGLINIFVIISTTIFFRQKTRFPK